jgi:CBS domain containing-hemolysin-like protein
MLAVELMSGDIVAMVAIVALLLASGFLALAETSLTSVSRTTATALVEEGRRGAARLSRLIDEPERFLNPVLLLLLVCQLFEAVLVGLLAYRLSGGWAAVIASAVNVGVVFVLTEAGPKTFAREHPVRSALFAAGPVTTIVTFPPIRLVSRGLIGLTNVLLPGKGLKKGPFVSEAKILALAEQAVEEDVIEAEERELIEQIIEFGDTIVREVMVPRPDMVTVSADFRVGDAMEVVILNGYSRIPATGEGVDDVVGIVFAKDLMRAERDGGAGREVAELLRPVHFVPETKKVAELLREMQAEQFHMALVIDEYGGTAGLVTLEDLIEELVGEIVDEFDREEPTVEPLAGGSVRVNARMAVDEVNELLHADLPEGDWDTVGGLLLDRLGRVAVEGDTAEVGGFVLRAERVKGRRIGRVHIEAAPAGESAAPPPTPSKAAPPASQKISR